jgi:sterol desaturase/sphingolipid hydroxylase (fatty acid hydroxylase superfamily)
MEEFLTRHENDIVLGMLIGSFVLAALWEVASPRRQPLAHSTRRWPANIGLGIANQVLGYWVYMVIFIALGWLAAHWKVGLFAGPDSSFVAALIITFLALDFTAYLIHRLMHSIPWLWRVHAVHHSDPDLDFTTTARNHPLEVLLIAFAAAPVIALLGPPVAILVLYQITRSFVVILAHSNIYIPRWIDSWLRYLVITPDFHRLHHSDDRNFTDSNFGVFLSVFDHILGTASRKPFEEQTTMTVGLEYLRDPADSRLGRLLLMPFRKVQINTLPR